VNIAHTVNAGSLSGSALERALEQKLTELLESVPWLGKWQVTRNPADFDRSWDLLAARHQPGKPDLELWVDCRTDPRPSQFPYVNVHREFQEHKVKRVRASVFAAPYISPRMAEICEEHGWSWFDLAGNCRISVPEVLHLERKGSDPVYARPRPSANLATPEAARVIRALLVPENAGTRWTQQALRVHCQPNVSVGLVNKVVRHLRDEAFLEEGADGGFKLHDPLKLLFAWRIAYRFDRHQRQGYFTIKQGRSLREALAGLELVPNGEAAYAAFSAAEFQAPHVRQPKTWLYLSPSLEEEFCKEVEAKQVDSGENLVVLTPDDDGVFYAGDRGIAGDNRLPATNPVQTYVDLFHCGSRGEEAAEAILEQNLKPEWKIRGVL
jgi:hypothetical protein